MKIISIDPDIDKSGYCLYCEEEEKIIDSGSLNISDLLNYCKGQNIKLALIENSNLNKRNWHGIASGKNVGKNQGISKIIVDLFETYLKIEVKQLEPKGYSKYFVNPFIRIELAKYGVKKKTNSDERSAIAMIIKEIMNKI